MVGAVVPVPVAMGAPSDVKRGSSVAGAGSTVVETPRARTPATDDPPPSAFAAVLAGLMPAPAPPPPAPSIEPGMDIVVAPPATVGMSDLSLDEAALPNQVEVLSASGRAAPVRSSVAESVLSTLMAFLPGQVDGQAVATAARMSTSTSMAIPIPIATSGIAGGVIGELIAPPPIAPPPTDASDLGEAAGTTVEDGPGMLDAELSVESPVAEPRLPLRRDLEAVAAAVRQAMIPAVGSVRAAITPPPLTATTSVVAVAAGAVPPLGPVRGTGAPVDAADAGADDGAIDGDAPSRSGAAPSALFATDGAAPTVSRAMTAVSATSAPSPVIDVSPPPPADSPHHATVDLALGDGLTGRLRITVRGEVLHATILADAVNAALLQLELPALRRALREHGFQEAHLTVRVPPGMTGPEALSARREASHPDQGGRDARPDQRPFTDDDRPRDRRRHPTEEELP